MLDMVKKDIMPAVFQYTKMLADTVATKKSIGIDVSKDACCLLVEQLTLLSNSLYEKTEALDQALLAAHDCKNTREEANYFRDTILSAMQELRAVADELETMVGEEYWPFPTYGELLFHV